MNFEKIKIGIVGLGYVGLPLALEFGAKFETVGLDISEEKILNYAMGVDPAGEVAKKQFLEAKLLRYSKDPATLSDVDFIIIAVPTPVDEAHKPDFSPLVDAIKLIAPVMKNGVTVIFESTVYPGATEEICVPNLETESGKKWGKDFFIGYSPERVNPGDKVHTLTNIVKVVSGDCEDTLIKVKELYSSIIKAGVHEVTSIKVAEASKVIENTQRDLNIALMNELAIVFNMIGIDTDEVLRAAGTKWNFLSFKPGLVGGHCIGVDPYYLTHKAEMLGYHPQVILAGRRINDEMPTYLAGLMVKNLIKSNGCKEGDSVLVCGITFKENCSDIRNSKAAELIWKLKSYGLKVYVHDPLAVPQEVLHEYDIQLTKWAQIPGDINGMVLAVDHEFYKGLSDVELWQPLKKGGIFLDVKSSRGVNNSDIKVVRL